MSSTNKNDKLKALLADMDEAKPAKTRLTTLFDADSFVELDPFMKAGEDEAGIIAGWGTIDGSVVYAYSQDASAKGGAVSVAHAKKATQIYELAAKNGCPVICIYDSKGAKLDEGCNMLAAYSEMLQWSNNLSGVVPQIAVVLGTCAGVSAMLAAGADFVVMNKEAELFLNAPFITKANGDSAEGAGTAENAAKSGIASLVCEDEATALAEVRKLISMLPQNNLASLPLFDFADNTDAIDPDGCQKQIVKAIADAGSTLELNAEFGKGASIFLGTMAGVTAAFVATSKEHPLDADACAKIARFVKFCDAFNVPVLTFIHSKGFELSADVRLIKESAKLASAYAEATTAKISVITGRACGSAFVALASKNAGADLTIAWPQAEISALAPETAVEFLWSDRFKGTSDVNATRAALVEEYIETEASPFEAAKSGNIGSIIAPEETRNTLIKLLDMLAGKRDSKLPKKHTTV